MREDGGFAVLSFATSFFTRAGYNERHGEVDGTTVYIDSVFALNAVMDYLLLLCAGRLAGIPLRRGRYLLAALAGGIYAAAVFFPGLSFLGSGAGKAGAAVALTGIAFGGERRYLRLLLLFLSTSFALAGCVLAVGMLTGDRVPIQRGVFFTDISGGILLTAAAAAYFLWAVVFRAAAGERLRGRLLPVRLWINGRCVTLTALYDSGNSLREPESGRPVLVVEGDALKAALRRENRYLLEPERLSHPAALLEPLRRSEPALSPRLLPYRAVGVSSGLLIAVRTERAEIGGAVFPRLLAALSPAAVGASYTALWGGEGVEGHGRDHPYAEGAAASAETDGGRGDPLYRRQRHAAASSESGAGGGTAAPP